MVSLTVEGGGFPFETCPAFVEFAGWTRPTQSTRATRADALLLPFSSMHTGSTTMSEKIQVSDVDGWRLQTWLRIQASTKPEVYQQVSESTEIDNLSYWLEIFLSAGIATFGYVESSPAVIIGATLISPLMGPIMATGYRFALRRKYGTCNSSAAFRFVASPRRS